MSTIKKMSSLIFAAFLVYGCSGDVDNKESAGAAATEGQDNSGSDGASGDGAGGSTENGPVISGGEDTFNGFLTQEDFVDNNSVKASTSTTGARRYLIQEVSFKNPLYQHNEQEQVYVTKILSDSHCPDQLWASLSAEVIDTNTIVIKNYQQDGGFAISYDCQTAPPRSAIKLRTNAKIKGNFYYQAHCPNTDLSQYAGESVQGLFPLFPGQNPKICPDDSDRSVFFQYEFDLDTESNFTLATGSQDRTIENNLVRYSFGSKDDMTKPCKIGKENDTFSISDCKQTKWKQLISYQGWTNGELDPITNNQDGNETLGFETIVFDGLTFSGDISAYQSGVIHFTHNDISGKVTYVPGANSQYQIGSDESQDLPWQSTQ
ncbi:MAG: hypothetical protein HRU09_06485 [Oligoflexales bacterium]|nr:hypothetical protein [Oligoflexales bacterium]